MRTRISQLTLYDGLGKKLEKTSLLFDEQGILAIGDHESPVDQEIDGQGLTCTPGWFNSHVHLAHNGEPNMQAHAKTMETEADVFAAAYRHSLLCLSAGMVTVRDLGTAFDVAIRLREALQKKLLQGPRIVASGRVICMTGGHGSFFGIEVDGPHEARKAARQLIKNGADVIKIMATGGGQSRGMKAGVPQLNREEIRAITEEAKHAGVSTAAHAQGKEGVMNCLKAGVDTIEHGVCLDDEQIECMVAQGTFFCPTLLAPYYVVEKGVAHGIPHEVVEKCKRQVDSHFKGFEAAVKAGVKIIAGNDAGTPYNSQTDLANEFRMMIKLGMSVSEVIQSASSHAAEAMLLSHVTGSIQVGLQADLTLLARDPEDSLQAFDEIRMVFKGGQLLYDARDGEGKLLRQLARS